MTEVTTVEVEDKGLKPGAVGFLSSIGVGLASTAPAYSLAATLGFVAVSVGVLSPLIVILAFIPMLLCSWALKEMNAVDPDCGTSFTWAWRAIGPRTGWFAGGWGTIASDFLAMGSYAQIAGQYLFLLLGLKSVGADPTSIWVLLVGIGWLIGLTWICYIGIEISAHMQVALVVVEVVMLVVLGAVALAKVLFVGGAPAYHLTPTWDWLNPFKFKSFGSFAQGMLLMVFIYWGWDTTTSLNEETEDPGRIPGVAGVVSTFILLGTYFFVVLGVQSYTGVGTQHLGLSNPQHVNDVLSVLGSSVFGSSLIGEILTKLLLFMILTSAAATTQTTILPNARTMLSMAFHKALPETFGKVHPRYKTPIMSTWSFSIASAIFYVALNFVSHGNVLEDAVDATVFFAALYLGISSAACMWHFRDRGFHIARKSVGRFSVPLVVPHGTRDAFSKFWVPMASTVLLYLLLIYNFIYYLTPDESYTEVNVPLIGHVGTTIIIVVVTSIVGWLCMIYCRRTSPQFFIDKAMRYGPSLTESGEVINVKDD